MDCSKKAEKTGTLANKISEFQEPIIKQESIIKQKQIIKQEQIFKEAQIFKSEEQIILQNAGLVRAVALRFFGVENEELEDLIQIGYIGLLKAARRFDSERGLKFSTYAVPLIAGEIKTQLRDKGRIKVSRSIKQDVFAFRRAENDYLAKNGKSPRLSEIAQITGLSTERIKEAMAADDALKNIENIEDADLHENDEERRVTRIDLKKSLEKMSEMQRKIILLRYYRDFTQRQVAGMLGISQAQVSRIEKKTLKKLSEEV